MIRACIMLAGASGFTAVALGAFGAHGLQRRLAHLPDVATRLQWWNTAAQYQMTHALALGLCAWLSSRGAVAPARVAMWAIVVGTVLFSGSLYVMTITGMRKLGAVTPFGGLAFLVAWAAVFVGAMKLSD